MSEHLPQRFVDQVFCVRCDERWPCQGYQASCNATAEALARVISERDALSERLASVTAALGRLGMVNKAGVMCWCAWNGCRFAHASL